MHDELITGRSVTAVMQARFEQPDAPALRFSGRTVSYGELDRRSAAVAATLVARGLEAESLIALAMQRSDDLVCWVLGCWRAGVAFLPLDPTYPVERLRYMVGDARPALVVTDRAAQSWAPDAILCTLPEVSRAPPISVARDDDRLAYVIYTSGSTGRSKGVEVPFRGLANLARNQIEAFAITSESHVLQFASPSFDAFVAELLSALFAGATLVIGTQADLRPGPDLVALCRRETVTVATFPPSLLAFLEPEDFPSLRTVVSAGEACSAAVVRRWATAERRFVNAYGPTESTVCATESVIVADEVDTAPPTIGAPLDNIEVLLLDGDLHAVDAGAIGELYLAGIGLARGYRGRPELTAERFMPHPSRDGARMYRTGDLAYRDPRGSLRFVGRVDGQVKLRGFRIELGEVEAALCSLPGVMDAVVVLRTTPMTGDALAGYVVVSGERSSVAATLREQLSTRLPSHMVPGTIDVLDTMPRGPNGKVDRQALPRARFARPGFWPPLDEPGNEDERVIVKHFKEVLGAEECGATDDFFALGGHSVAVALVLSRLARSWQRPIPNDVLFANPTARRLAAWRHDDTLRSTSQLPDCIVSLHQPSDGSTASHAVPLFLFHPVTGNVACYRPLATVLGADRPIYGVQSWRLSGRDSIGSSFAEMCASYVAAVRAACPNGPYLLGGWSVGGSIAVEVARLLAGAGATVALVLLLDAWSASLNPRPAPTLDDAFVSFLFIKNNLGRATGVDLPFAPPQLAALSAEERLELMRTAAVRHGILPPDAPVDELRGLFQIFADTLRAFMVFETQPYDGRVLHLQATTPAPGHPRPPTLGWERFLSHCENISIPDSSHFVFVYPPFVEQLGLHARRAFAGLHL